MDCPIVYRAIQQPAFKCQIREKMLAHVNWLVKLLLTPLVIDFVKQSKI